MQSLWRMRSKRICRIDTGAFTAVLLVITMLFMFGSWLLYPHRSSVDLPSSQSAVPMRGELREDAISVGISRDGRTFLDGSMLRPGELSAGIQRHVNQGAEPKVYIRADARAHYGDVVDVFKEIQTADRSCRLHGRTAQNSVTVAFSFKPITSLRCIPHNKR